MGEMTVEQKEALRELSDLMKKHNMTINGNFYLTIGDTWVDFSLKPVDSEEVANRLQEQEE